ncbi:MAG: hypothetical protein KDC67_12390 [Ignavibacteriae bacterium]|nr:hypothetical protein [Ignavibacteriota bacterium]
MSRLFLYFFCFFALSSCKPIYKTVNGINKNLSFKNLKEYENYIKSKTDLNPKKIYFIDNKDYINFIFDVSNRKVVYYYGIFRNDELIADGSD